ncbi:MAG TPA: hypothetical protein VFW11_13130 [Cyclobacteriaceae bacterium]|nr:hypothetical protein [Cyclobacteriaceae bacterium]
MRDFIIQVIVVALLGYLLELFFPWWSIAIAAALGGTFLRSNANFWAGFAGIGMLWLVTALLIDFTSPSGLASKVANILMMNKPILLIVTTLIGASVGGLACYTGSLIGLRKKVAQ